MTTVDRTTAPDRMAARLTVPFQRGADRLPLTLVADPLAPGRATVGPYDFGEHRARFGVVPDPRYVVTALYDVPAEPAEATGLTLTVGYNDGTGTSQTVTVAIPPGTLAGTSVLLDLGADEGPGTRLTSLAMAPAPPPGTAVAADRWDLRALLGTMGRLLWVLGGARDELRAHAARVRRLPRLPEATGHTLDLIGYDLAVPRFPPLPYAFSDGTVALYHLEDQVPSGGSVVDATTLYGGIGHPGTVTAARTGAVGRFGRGVAFEAPAAEIAIANHPDFTLAAAASFTAECFVRPADGAWEGAVLSKHAAPAEVARSGWAISIGEFGRGIPRSVRFLAGDGNAANPVLLFADETLPTTRFSHLAAVIDRAGGQARLYVDGVLRATRPLGQLGALTNSIPVRIGRAAASAAAAFQGIVDEVRLSRAARTGFHPVLGESDDGYRRRLRIFQQWRLPTPEGLREALNDAVGQIQGVDRPLVVDDTDATLAGGSLALRVLPDELAAGESIDDLGRHGTNEAEVNGTPEEDPGFDPELLVDGTDPRALFLLPTNAPARPNRMRVGTRRALRALLDLIAATQEPGRLNVAFGYPPNSDVPATFTELFAVGRKLGFFHDSLSSRRLAALAHRAGFTWVRALPDNEDSSPSAFVFASVRSTQTVEIELIPGGSTATPENGFDLLAGQTLAVRVVPPLPVRAQLRWYTIAVGAGRAELTGRADQAAALLTARRPGDLVVGVQVMIGSRSFRATRALRIGIAALNAGESIAATGELGAGPSVAGQPGEDFFAPAYLDTVRDSRVSFGPGANTQRMAPVLTRRLVRLLDLLAVAGDPGRPLVASAWQPSGTGLETEGRALTLERGTLTMPLGRLGALAHAAGFSHVASDGSRLRILQAAANPVEITGGQEPRVGSTVELQLRPAARPQGTALAGNVLYTANAGTETVSAIDTATGRVIRVVKVGLAPMALAAGPDGRIYCADRDGGTITVIDAATGGVIRTVDVGVGGGGPADLACHPSQPRLYVACLDGRVIQVNTTTFAVAGTLAFPPSTAALDIQPGGARLWVAAGDSTVRVIDTTTFAVAATVTLNGPPADIVVAAARAYVTVPDRDALQVLAVPTPAVQATFTDLGPNPSRLALTPDGQVLYVTDAGQATLYLRQADGRPQAPPVLPPRASPDRVPTAIAADNSRVYLVGARSGQGDEGAVGVIDARASASPLTAWPLGTGHGERLSWSVRSVASARVRLSSTTRQSVNLTCQSAGPLQVQATYQWPDHTPPYIFEVRLAAALEAIERAGTPVVIHKDQFDLIMNVLNELHPVGVEVDTRVIREHVVEVRQSLLEVFPGYTYPDFRARGPRPQIPPIGHDERGD